MRQVQWPVNQYAYDSPHSKTSLLFQAHFAHLKFWIPDYLTDLKSVLDQVPRRFYAISIVLREYYSFVCNFKFR
jgi:hypothetical protein